MSKIGQYRQELQEMPEYRKGFIASNSGFPRQRHAWMTPRQNDAYLIGWDDARHKNEEREPNDQ